MYNKYLCLKVYYFDYWCFHRLSLSRTCNLKKKLDPTGWLIENDTIPVLNFW